MLWIEGKMEKQNPRYFQPNICIVCKSHWICEPSAAKHSQRQEKARSSTSQVVKSSDFRRQGNVEWGLGEAGRPFTAVSMEREWVSAEQDAAIQSQLCWNARRSAFTGNSPKSIRYANLHSSNLPIQPNQYANLLFISKVGVQRGGWPFVRVGYGSEGGRRWTETHASAARDIRMDNGNLEHVECALVGGRC